MNDKVNEITNRISRATNAIKNPKRAMIFLWWLVCLKDFEAYRIGSWNYGNLRRVPITEVFPGIEKVNVKIMRVFDRIIGTSLDAHEVLVLSAIEKQIKAKNILEIGTYDGNTTLNLAANSPSDAVVSTIDLPPDWNKRLELTVPDSFKNVTDRSKIGSQYKNTVYSKKIKQIFCDSAKVDWNKMLIPFDFVFIDGCHHYEYVKKDTQSAMKYLKPGGIIVWHDYGMIKDVSDVVDETAERIKVKAIQGTRLAVGFVE